MRVTFKTFGCKANQYDTERMRQELEARGAITVESPDRADCCVINTCTVTNQADAQARRHIRRLGRENPSLKLVVAGCSAALKASDYAAMDRVVAVVPGHDPIAVAEASTAATLPASVSTPMSRPSVGAGAGAGAGAGDPPTSPRLVQLGTRRSLDELDREPVGGEILLRREGGTRGWLKIQDGCDRKCAFCATRLARGRSRSRDPDEIVLEARQLARSHPELVLTGIHIGHYGGDLQAPVTLSGLMARLLDEVPDARFRLGSIEATEVDDLLLELFERSDGRLAPHLHMPLQSGADPVLRRMRRWHTREMYRARALEIADRIRQATGGVLGLGADIITGFPGETDEDHARTVALVDELPYTYLHVFPFSPREGTVAARLVEEMPVPQRVAGERSRDLRELVQARETEYRRRRAGTRSRIVLEAEGRSALTEDYLRVGVTGPPRDDRRMLHDAALADVDGELVAVLASA